MDSVWLALAGVVAGCFAIAALAWFLGREDRRLIAKEREAARAAGHTKEAAR